MPEPRDTRPASGPAGVGMAGRDIDSGIDPDFAAGTGRSAAAVRLVAAAGASVGLVHYFVRPGERSNEERCDFQQGGAGQERPPAQGTGITPAATPPDAFLPLWSCQSSFLPLLSPKSNSISLRCHCPCWSALPSGPAPAHCCRWSAGRVPLQRWGPAEPADSRPQDPDTLRRPAAA